MNGDNEIFLRLVCDMGEQFNRLHRAEMDALHAETQTILERAERVKQDKPMSRKGDRT